MKAISALPLCALTLQSGCGTYVPDLQNFYELHAPDAEQVKVQTLIEYVACDVIKSVREVLLKDQDNAVNAAALGYKRAPSTKLA